MDPNLIYYEPYDSCFHQKQVKLLLLYNELGLPHVKKKQVFGWFLEVISLFMNWADMTILMSDMATSCNQMVMNPHLDQLGA